MAGFGPTIAVISALSIPGPNSVPDMTAPDSHQVGPSITTEHVAASVGHALNTGNITYVTARNCETQINDGEYSEIIMNLRNQHPSLDNFSTDINNPVTFFHRGCKFLAYKDPNTSHIYVKNTFDNQWEKILIYEINI